jgi:RNA polymerase sigma-70 factor (ECF subfamily)
MTFPLAGLVARLFNPRPDADLRAAARGDAAAIGRFYDAHVDALYAFVFYRVGRDAALAEDVVQETFTVALGRVGEYDAARGSVMAWLCTLSRNQIRDQLRAHKRSDQLAETWERIDASLAQIFAGLERAPLPGAALEHAEIQHMVNVTIAHLPEQYRVVLARKYVDGDSVETLAGDLGLSPDAVKSLLARARRAFRDTFATLGPALTEVS